ncbi:DUF3180 domain-containing protein [Catenuloplanes niger JCM 9533]|uniref:DUF3180 domain-containing protein n=2 Tax=Micromonosporaceae TaxID=28056 RepID=A0AAE3ZU14_9ACTN|nr:hypothetical protein [Catenuloplanes niger]
MSERSEQAPNPAPPPPTMGPTRASTLLVAALAAAAVGWLLISGLYYGEHGVSVPWLPTVTIAALAVLEAYLAYNTRSRIERRPGQEPVEPLAVARFAVLAKASSAAGAIYAGFSGAMLVWLLIETTRAAEEDRPSAAGGLIASIALIAAALWLERACRVPDRDDDASGSGRKP